jgi:ABC-type nitrate/sulfonate/bicarbonate transport system permease component
MAKVKDLLVSYYSIPLLLIAWEICSKTEMVNNFLLPPVSTILFKGVELVGSGELIRHTCLTLYRSVVSFGLAALIGVPLGILMAKNRIIHWFFDPIISVWFPIPKISFFPIFMLWFGMFDVSKISMSAFAALFPIVNATYLGTLRVNEYLLWSAKNMGTSERRILWRVVLPAAIPQIFNGFQIAFPLALVVVSSTEMLSTGGGLGNFMMLESRFARSPSVFVGIVSLTIIGYALMKVLEWLRSVLLLWHTEAENKF